MVRVSCKCLNVSVHIKGTDSPYQKGQSASLGSLLGSEEEKAGSGPSSLQLWEVDLDVAGVAVVSLNGVRCLVHVHPAVRIAGGMSLRYIFDNLPMCVCLCSSSCPVCACVAFSSLLCVSFYRYVPFVNNHLLMCALGSRCGNNVSSLP